MANLAQKITGETWQLSRDSFPQFAHLLNWIFACSPVTQTVSNSFPLYKETTGEVVEGEFRKCRYMRDCYRFTAMSLETGRRVSADSPEKLVRKLS